LREGVLETEEALWKGQGKEVGLSSQARSSSFEVKAAMPRESCDGALQDAFQCDICMQEVQVENGCLAWTGTDRVRVTWTHVFSQTTGSGR